MNVSTTLVAVTGLSPAIVTETLWALAKQKPAVIPEKIVFITTITGAARLDQQIFTPKPEWGGLSVWDALRKSLKAPAGTLVAEAPAVITMPDPAKGRTTLLDDIRTPEENAAAAEFIFGRIWDVVRDKNQRLIASVAGGRKTMGALLHSAVSLIGRETDLLTHILVDSPFDSLPGFFFPGQPGGDLRDREENAHPPRKARLILASVPFVPLRNRFKELDDLPGSFLNLRDQLASRLSQDAEREVPIRIEPERKRFFVDGKAYRANHLQLAVLEFILRAHGKKQSFAHASLSPQELAANAFAKWVSTHADRYPGLVIDPSRGARLITHPLSELRTQLRHAAWQPAKGSFLQAPFRLES
jgi:CRISPR-associated protein (TIGR02584 family)